MLNKIKRLFVKDHRKILFSKHYQELLAQQKQNQKRFELSKKDFFPILHENTVSTGFDRHYVYHPAWAVRIIKSYNPEKHIDISSSLYFCSILSAFIPVDFYDYRPANLKLDQLRSLTGDVTDLPFESGTVSSLSCMHTIEHIGLGRYGDEINYNGDIDAINELKRVLAPNGNLLFVVPLGAKDKIHFNAHRVYSKQQVLQLFSDMELKEFTLIPEDEKDGGLITDPDQQLLDKQAYGCGCFWFKKTISPS